ncbi:carboxymuconolactone decarboxylase family protein [Streptomyces sp. ISL-11]|nr:carboxymuconolactone decarboxylase family protein [Streptomyces sp. ISL-11]
MNFTKAAPKVFKAMIALDTAARAGLDPTLIDLVQIRASQLNHCAYCIDMHTKEARKAGESEERIYQLNAWRAAGLFTAKEKAALGLTEAATTLADGEVPDAVYAEAARHFEEPELAQLIALIFTVNAWNRIAVPTRKIPGTE